MSSRRLADMLDAADDLRTERKESGNAPRADKKPCENPECGSLDYKMRAYGNKPEQCYCDVCRPDWAKRKEA